MKSKISVLSVNPGIGQHLLPYASLGGDVRLVFEKRPTERTIFEKNSNIPCSETDIRWFLNRKEKGLQELLALLKLRKTGELDFLEINSNFETVDKADEKHFLYNVFGLARILEPKVVIFYGPDRTVQNSKFDDFVNFLRFDKSKDRAERKYFVLPNQVDTSLYGNGIAKRLTVIVALRSDVAKKIGLSTDQGISLIFPRGRAPKTYEACLKNSSTEPKEAKFWFQKTNGDLRLSKAFRHIPADVPNAEMFLPSVRLKEELGFPKSWISNVVRSSKSEPIPDPDKYLVLHPTENRQISLSELSLLSNLPSSFDFTKCSSVDAFKLLAKALPAGLTKEVFEKVVVRALSGEPKIDEQKNPTLKRVRQAETLLTEVEGVRTYYCEFDTGLEASEKTKGKTPGIEHYDFLFDANEIDQDFTVLGPFDPVIGRRAIIGSVKRKVFENEERSEIVAAITSVREKTDKRVDCATKEISTDTIEKFKKANRPYQLKPDNKQIRVWIEAKDKSPGHWDLWRSEPIPSATVGWLRDKQSKKPKFAGQNDEAFTLLNKKAERAYYQLAKSDFIKQRTFLSGRMPRLYRLGGTIFTTLAVNQYGSEMPAMGFHQDTGNENSGLTTISVFNEGSYEGAHFVLPRYRCAFKIGDGDVFVANSRQFHGVTTLKGEGKRLSVVSYTKTDLAHRVLEESSYRPKSQRPVFRWNQYEVAIVLPSSLKSASEVLSVDFCLKQGIPLKKITLFQLGKNKLDMSSAVGSPRCVTGSPEEFYKENTPVILLAHDVEGYLTKEKPTALIGKNFISEVIRRGFDACRENKAYLFSWNNNWSITNAGDQTEPGALSDNILIGEFHPASSCVGIILRKSIQARFDTTDDASWKMGNENFRKDGRIVRLDSVSDLFNYKYVETPFGEPQGKSVLCERLQRTQASALKLLKPQVLAIGGEPAVGKTTIMREFIKRLGPWEKVKKGSIVGSYQRERDVYLLGDYTDGEQMFGGTDQLSMSVQPEVVAFLQKLKPTTKVIYEGARLFTGSFFEQCLESKIGIEIIEITASPATLVDRHKRRGDKQNSSFLNTQKSKVRNVVGSRELFRHVKSLPHETREDTEVILRQMERFCGVGRAKHELAAPAPIKQKAKLDARELFLQWFAWSLRYGDCDPAIWLTNYLHDRFESNVEQRYWLSWLYGNTYNLPTAWVLMNEFPDFELATVDRITHWNTANYKRLRYQTDTKWNKGHLPEMFASYQKFIGAGTQQERFAQLCSGSPSENFQAVWDEVKSKLHKFGRYGTWFYLQHLRHTAKLNIEPGTLMLNDYAGSRSHRNGLLKALSREKDFDKKLLPSDYERLEKQSSEILSEVRARFPDLAVKADYFAMETCLCSFKKVWRANSSRYLGYYAERQAEEISQASQDGWTGIEWNVMEDGRVEKLDPRLLERVSKIRAQSFVNSFLSTHELERLDWIV